MNLLKTSLQRDVLAAEGPTTRSAPMPIPARATSAQDSKEQPPSPTASLSGDKYILVRAPKPLSRISQLAEAGVTPSIVKDGCQSVDLKSELCTTSSSLSTLKGVGDMLKSGSGFGKQAVYRMRIVIANQTTSAAATPSAPVYAIEPNLSTELATLSALFSEFRVKPEVAFHYNLGWSGAPNQQMASIAYDPCEGTSLTSTSNGLQSSQNDLIGFGPSFTSPIATGSGYRTFRFKLLPGVITNGSVTGLASADQWQPTSAANGKFGYVRAYIPNGPSGVTSTLQSYMMIDVEFRNRT